ncbi:MAG: hypothetical protein JXR90_13190, partial [Spirochaetes bacterium]|nr:hypothetical protein [Spirochaetota bacterium]
KNHSSQKNKVKIRKISSAKYIVKTRSREPYTQIHVLTITPYFRQDPLNGCLWCVNRYDKTAFLCQ